MSALRRPAAFRERLLLARADALVSAGGTADRYPRRPSQAHGLLGPDANRLRANTHGHLRYLAAPPSPHSLASLACLLSPARLKRLLL